MAPLCPFHFLTRYLAFLNDFFSELGRNQAHCLPLFPTASGEVLSKAQVVHALRDSIAATGTPFVAVDTSGVQRQRFGEHVARVAGAQALARAGVDVSLIELIGRRGSSAIRRYVQQAALAVQPLVVARLARGAAVSAELLASRRVRQPCRSAFSPSKTLRRFPRRWTASLRTHAARDATSRTWRPPASTSPCSRRLSCRGKRGPHGATGASEDARVSSTVPSRMRTTPPSASCVRSASLAHALTRAAARKGGRSPRPPHPPRPLSRPPRDRLPHPRAWRRLARGGVHAHMAPSLI